MRTSSIDNFDQIVQLDGIDYDRRRHDAFTYGVNNRFYAKRTATPGQPAQSREIFDVELSQTYYTDAARRAVRPALPDDASTDGDSRPTSRRSR